MTTSVRELDLKRDRNTVITFLNENLATRPKSARFRWLYLRNPSGPARAWVVFDEQTDEIMGLGAAFPRLVWFGGKRRRAWVLGDLCVTPENRSLGPALLLQRACLQSLATDHDAIWFDFPSASMMAVYRRLGFPTYGNHVRFVKLFGIDHKVGRYIQSELLAKSISRIGNSALRLRWQRYRPLDIDVHVHEGAFGEEFTRLDSLTVKPDVVRGLRPAEYLNWRYRQNPFARYEVIVAKHHAELLGYAVLEMHESDWILSDLQAIEDSEAIPSILSWLDRVAIRRKLASVSVSIMEGAPLAEQLRRAGFLRREALPVVISMGDHRPQITQQWRLMHGDRES